MADFMEVSEAVAKIGATFPNWKPDKFTVQVYFEDLRDLPADLLKVAADKCRTESGRKFAPSTGEIRGAAGEIRAQLAGVPTSYDAWKEVQVQIADNGGDFGNPVWSHPLVEKTVQTIGWRVLRMSEDRTADRARFIEAYEQFRGRAMTDEMELPEVRAYIESKGGKQLPAADIKQLTERLSK